MKINTRYDYWEMVYLKTDTDQSERMVTGIRLLPGAVIYTLSLGNASSEHYEQEITATANVVKKLTE